MDKGMNLAEWPVVDSASHLFPPSQCRTAARHYVFSGSPALYGSGLEFTSERNS